MAFKRGLLRAGRGERGPLVAAVAWAMYRKESGWEGSLSPCGSKICNYFYIQKISKRYFLVFCGPLQGKHERNTPKVEEVAAKEEADKELKELHPKEDGPLSSFKEKTMLH